MDTTTNETGARMLRRRDLERIYGFARSTIYALIRQGDLPAPVKIGRAAYWIAADVETAVAKLVAKSVPA